MPLSDREQRILDEIEKSLYQEDPGFARGGSVDAPPGKHLRNAKLGAAAFIGGLLLLLTFFASRLVIVGLLSFGCMVGGLVLLAGALRGLAESSSSSAPDGRSRVGEILAEWEEAVRRRYKKR